MKGGQKRGGRIRVYMGGDRRFHYELLAHNGVSMMHSVSSFATRREAEESIRSVVSVFVSRAVHALGREFGRLMIDHQPSEMEAGHRGRDGHLKLCIRFDRDPAGEYF